MKTPSSLETLNPFPIAQRLSEDGESFIPSMCKKYLNPEGVAQVKTRLQMGFSVIKRREMTKGSTGKTLRDTATVKQYAASLRGKP